MNKVCHCSSVHRGLDIRIYHKQCLSLARGGFETHLVIRATHADIAEAASAGVTIHPLEAMARGGRIRRVLLQTWRCYRIAKALNADVYHLHDPELIPFGVLLHWQGKKVIADFHEDLRSDICSKKWIPSPLRPAIGVLARGLERLAARHFSAVVAATPHIGTLFENSAAPVAVIHNYPTINELAPAPSCTKVKRDSVCYVGGMNEIRGIRQIIRALESAPSTLLLAGVFDSPELREELTGYPGWRYVEEWGFVDRRRVAEIMSRSYCGLLTYCPDPNYINALPNKLFEYMSAGLPVIASDFPLWRSIVEEADCGVCVDPEDPDGIASAINYFRTHPALAEKMGNNGRRAVESKYRWDHEEAKLFALYGQLLAGASRQHSN